MRTAEAGWQPDNTTLTSLRAVKNPSQGEKNALVINRKLMDTWVMWVHESWGCPSYFIPYFMNLHDNKRKGPSMLFRVKANFLWLNLRDKAALFLPVWVIWLSFCLLSVVCQSRSGAAWCLAENWPFMKQNNNIFLRQFCSNLQNCLCDFVTSCHSPGTLISGDFVQF